MGVQFIRSQTQLLSSRPYQTGPNLPWECYNDIMKALAAATADKDVYLHRCLRDCVHVERREGDEDLSA